MDHFAWGLVFTGAIVGFVVEFAFDFFVSRRKPKLAPDVVHRKEHDKVVAASKELKERLSELEKLPSILEQKQAELDSVSTRVSDAERKEGELNALKSLHEAHLEEIELLKIALVSKDELVQNLQNGAQGQVQTPEITDLKREISERDAELQNLKKDLEQNLSDRDTLNADLAKTQAQLESAQQELAALKAQPDNLGQGTSPDSAEALRLVAEVETLKSEVAKKTEQVSALTSELGGLKASSNFESADYEGLKSELASKTEELTTLKSELEAARDEATSVSAQANDFERQLTALNFEAASLKADLDRLQTELKDKEDCAKQAEERLAQLESELKSTRKERDAHSGRVAELQSDIAGNSQSLETAKATLGSLENELAGLKNELESRNSDLESMRASLEGKQAAFVAKDAEIQKLQSELQDSGRKLADASGEVSKFKTDFEEREHQVQTLQAESQERQAAWETAKAALEQRESDLAELKSALETRTGELKSLQEESTRLKSALEAKSADAGSSSDLKAALDAKTAEITQLQGQLKAAEAELKSLKDHSESYRAALVARESEVARLSEQLKLERSRAATPDIAPQTQQSFPKQVQTLVQMPAKAPTKPESATPSATAPVNRSGEPKAARLAKLRAELEEVKLAAFDGDDDGSLKEKARVLEQAIKEVNAEPSPGPRTFDDLDKAIDSPKIPSFGDAAQESPKELVAGLDGAKEEQQPKNDREGMRPEEVARLELLDKIKSDLAARDGAAEIPEDEFHQSRRNLVSAILKVEYGDGPAGPHDPLIQIRGINPLFELRLVKAGVSTFEKLASLDADAVREIVRPNPSQLIDFEQWINDAKLRVNKAGA